MIDKILFGNSGFDLGKRALDAGAERQRVIASNLANAATPGYQAREVAFEELLDSAVAPKRTQLAQTQPGHLAGKHPSLPAPLIRPQSNTELESGVNNVSVEHEMSEMGQNALHFQAVSQFLANKYRAIRDAIHSGG